MLAAASAHDLQTRDPHGCRAEDLQVPSGNRDFALHNDSPKDAVAVLCWGIGGA